MEVDGMQNIYGANTIQLPDAKYYEGPYPSSDPEAQNPSKVKIFIGLLLRNRMLTKHNLVRRGWMSELTCVLCEDELETTNHLLHNCDEERKPNRELHHWPSARSFRVHCMSYGRESIQGTGKTKDGTAVKLPSIEMNKPKNQETARTNSIICSYPGVRSGSTILFPKSSKVKPTGDGSGFDCDESSTKCRKLKDVPEEGHFKVTVAAIPTATANLARNDVPGLLGFAFNPSSISLISLSSLEGSNPETDALFQKKRKRKSTVGSGPSKSKSKSAERSSEQTMLSSPEQQRRISERGERSAAAATPSGGGGGGESRGPKKEPTPLREVYGAGEWMRKRWQWLVLAPPPGVGKGERSGDSSSHRGRGEGRGGVEGGDVRRRGEGRHAGGES
ncbi:hypothetical protein ACMD2_24328 [Ananas comosus]|uniref:Reverse transcriptase zinc-binding domain-containing protein n=1 Tax=Ananas comosus TaxID=4615 RepID=A0A199VCW5_ANACO|nr:hypothetical protein ACMD2_24328 [Ananas comosus]